MRTKKTHRNSVSKFLELTFFSDASKLPQSSTSKPEITAKAKTAPSKTPLTTKIPYIPEFLKPIYQNEPQKPTERPEILEEIDLQRKCPIENKPRINFPG